MTAVKCRVARSALSHVLQNDDRDPVSVQRNLCSRMAADVASGRHSLAHQLYTGGFRQKPEVRASFMRLSRMVLRTD